MRLKFTSQVIPHGVVIVVVATGLWLAREWPYETALFPMTAGLTIIIIALTSMLLEMRKSGVQSTGGAVTWAPPAHANIKAVVDFLWLTGFIFGIWALGYVAASLTFLFLYMKVKGKQAWLISILITVGAFAFLELIFGMLLGIKWFTGALWVMLDL
jgi:hypothetical protein